MRKSASNVLPVLPLFYLLFAVQAVAQPANDYFDFSLEELVNVNVVSLSKAPEPRSKSPSAISVITAEVLSDYFDTGSYHIQTAGAEVSSVQPGIFQKRKDTPKYSGRTPKGG